MCMQRTDRLLHTISNTCRTHLRSSFEIKSFNDVNYHKLDLESIVALETFPNVKSNEQKGWAGVPWMRKKRKWLESLEKQTKTKACKWTISLMPP